MELFILGVESPYPRRGRATLGYTLMQEGFLLVLETGFGIHRRLAEEGLLDRVEGILLSHLHCDHSADLPAVILGVTVGRGRKEPLPVYLPPGEVARLREWLCACGFAFVLEHTDLRELAYDEPTAIGPFRVTMGRAAHSLPAGIFTFTAAGTKFVYTGDTGDCPPLRAAIPGADLLLAEATPLRPEEAAVKGHLTAPALGEMARAAGVRRLVITHFMPGEEPAALAEKATVAFGAPVTAAEEGLHLVI
ncbi:MAG: MBL fold metallo-hydrolase [Firmicutes bacterium]|nr:MBL fold metallo-hydrolase [Bacillota bacterium]